MCAASHLARLQLATQPLLQHSSEQSHLAALALEADMADVKSTFCAQAKRAVCIAAPLKICFET